MKPVHVLVNLTVNNVRKFELTIGWDPTRCFHSLVFNEGPGVAESVCIGVNFFWPPTAIRDFERPGPFVESLLLDLVRASII